MATPKVTPSVALETKLRRLRLGGGWFSARPAVQADACRLPLADGTVDVIFANLLLPWIDDPEQFFREAARVLRKEGLLVFSTLGPDSLLARTAGTIYGSTETTFYVVAVYFGAVAVKRTRHAVPAGLIADAVGIIAAVVICRLMFA